MSSDSDQSSFAELRRPMLFQRVVLTLVVSGLVVVLPLGPNRFLLAATILVVQLTATFVIEHQRLDLIDQLGQFLFVEQLLVAAAGVIVPQAYVAASMISISALAINAPYLDVRWLRRIAPATIAATIIAPLIHDIDGALPIICISTLISLHMTFNRSGAVLLAADAMERAQHQADHDPLTGLANRRVLVQRLDELEPVTEMGLLLLDLNEFKEINDTYGHDVGDAVLRSVADRLRESDDSVLALRLGGDEFAVMVPGAAHETRRIADLVLAHMAEPVLVGEAEVRTGASIGMSHTSTAAPHELLRFADIAMFAAKRTGAGLAWYSAADDPGRSKEVRRAIRDHPSHRPTAR